MASGKIEDSAEAEEVDRLLSSVIKYRRTVPGQWVELKNEVAKNQRIHLENAKIITEESKKDKEFKSALNDIRRLKLPKLEMAEFEKSQEKLLRCLDKTIEINNYLQTRMSYKSNILEIQEP